MGFNRNDGRAIIRTERKSKGGGNRLNTSRYRLHIARCEQLGTVAIAGGLRRIERETAATPGVAGGAGAGATTAGQDFLETLANAIVAELAAMADAAAKAEQQPQSDSSSASTSDGGPDEGGPQINAGDGGEQPAAAEQPVEDEYPVNGGTARFLTTLAKKAIKQRWAVSDELRGGVLSGLSHLLVRELSKANQRDENGEPMAADARTVLGVCKTVAMLERQNQTDELAGTPALHLHANATQNAERTISDADSRASVAKAIDAELRKRGLLAQAATVIESRAAAARDADASDAGTVDGGTAGPTSPSGGGTDTG